MSASTWILVSLSNASRRACERASDQKNKKTIKNRATEQPSEGATELRNTDQPSGDEEKPKQVCSPTHTRGALESGDNENDVGVLGDRSKKIGKGNRTTAPMPKGYQKERYGIGKKT